MFESLHFTFHFCYRKVCTGESQQFWLNSEKLIEKLPFQYAPLTRLFSQIMFDLFFPFFQMIEDPPFPCLNGDGLQDGGCWGPPPIFDIPPPPRPPWGDPNCDENDLRSRPLTSDQDGSLGQGSRSHLTGEDFIQDSCDIHPLVIDSHFYLGESLFTILVIVICSCILVGIILVVACVIYR